MPSHAKFAINTSGLAYGGLSLPTSRKEKKLWAIRRRSLITNAPKSGTCSKPGRHESIPCHSLHAQQPTASKQEPLAEICTAVAAQGRLEWGSPGKKCTTLSSQPSALSPLEAPQTLVFPKPHLESLRKAMVWSDAASGPAHSPGRLPPPEWLRRPCS